MAKGSKKKADDKVVDLKTVLWNCRVALRGVGSTEKNRDAVIGLTFLKFAGDKFEKRRAEILSSKKDACFVDEPAFYTGKNSGFYLSERSRWGYIVKHAGDDDIANKLDLAMSDIDQTNEMLTGALPENLYTTLGASPEKLKTLIDEVNKIDEQRFQEEDLIGRVYEYFLQVYAAAGTREDGEFYTPASVVRLIAELIEPYNGTVYDPCCGSGGMFVQSLKFVDRHNGNRKMVSVLGQESNKDTWKLCKMNLAIRGLEANLGGHNADTFHDDLHKTLKANYILANPPFNVSDWGGDRLQDDIRWKYGVPPVNNANFAWLQHMIHHLNPAGGVAGTVLANGSLTSNTQVESSIRKNMIIGDVVDCIVAMPEKLFYSTSIPVSLWIMRKGKKATTSGKILFIDARHLGHMIDKRVREFSEEDILKIASTYHSWQKSDGYEDIAGFCKSANLQEVQDQEFILAPGRYVGYADDGSEQETYEDKMNRISSELAVAFEKAHDLEGIIRREMTRWGYEI